MDKSAFLHVNDKNERFYSYINSFMILRVDPLVYYPRALARGL